MVLKTPKTAGSTRKIFLPKTVASMLIEWKKEQDFTREALGSEYQDYNLVMAGTIGLPIEPATIKSSLNKLIEEHDLPKVVFHSLRHSSITYKRWSRMCTRIFWMMTVERMHSSLKMLSTKGKVLIQRLR